MLLVGVEVGRERWGNWIIVSDEVHRGYQLPTSYVVRAVTCAGTATQHAGAGLQYATRDAEISYSGISTRSCYGMTDRDGSGLG